MTRILLVEDDAALARGLGFNLRHEGFEVLHASSLAEAREALTAEGPFRLVVLDLGLPDGDGTDLLQHLQKEKAPPPTLCLSARTSEADVVSALRLGAEDFVRKPFGLAELSARIGNILRRSPASPETTNRDAGNRLVLGPITIDLEARTVVREDGEQLTLTPTETELLSWFRDRPGEAHERQAILAAIWGLEQAGATRTLDNHLARLRRKIEVDPAEPRHLVTVHGVGYRFDPS